MTHEYRAIAAPRRGLRARGVRDPEARFALAVEAEMNRMAADGWEYVRSDTLPSEEKQGLLGGRATVFRTLLVFRRARPAPAAEPAVELGRVAPAPAPVLRAPPPLVAVTPSPVAAPPEAPPAVLPEAPARLAAE